MKEHRRYTKDIGTLNMIDALGAYLLLLTIVALGFSRKILQQI